MHVAPAPRFAALERRDHRVAGRIEVLQSVRVLRVLAAADVAAGEAQAKMYPGVAGLQTLLATVASALNLAYLVQVGAGEHTDPPISSV
jgi:hypothetical protein